MRPFSISLYGMFQVCRIIFTGIRFRFHHRHLSNRGMRNYVNVHYLFIILTYPSLKSNLLDTMYQDNSLHFLRRNHCMNQGYSHLLG
jgi:hypothetical protein